MPEKDGQKLIKRIRSYGNTQVAEMPILAVAGEEENDKLKQKALKEGASDFLTKNTDDVEILARVRVHHKLVQTTGDINTRYQLANQLLNVRERLSNTAPSAPKSSTHNNQRIVSKIGLITLGVVIVVTAILALYYKHDSTKKTERITAELKVRPKTNNSKIVSLDSVLTAKSSSKADNQSATNSRDAKPTFNLKSLSDENRKPTARSKKISDANTAFNRASKNETKSNPLPDYLFTIDKTAHG